MALLPFIHRVCGGTSLTEEDARIAMTSLLSGHASEVQISAFLVALKMKGETPDEIAGFARAMRESMILVDAGENVVDTSGTGGDGSGTFNISTATAFVMAGAGAKVAKHGNRSVSSNIGSADVLEELGIRIALSPQEAASAIAEVGIGFLFAPNLHPAMKHAQPVRRELKLRTALNLLGPLCNPARAQAQLIGAPTPQAAHLMAQALAKLGTRKSFVVHGDSGLDEVSTTGPTDVYEVKTGHVSHRRMMPDDFGVARAKIDALLGGDRKHNAAMIRAVLGGEKGAPRDIVLVNAALGLMAAGLASSIEEAMACGERSIDSGAAAEKVAWLAQRFPNR
jgi:anthranilate phosphoribosyltransferase